MPTPSSFTSSHQKTAESVLSRLAAQLKKQKKQARGLVESTTCPSLHHEGEHSVDSLHGNGGSTNHEEDVKDASMKTNSKLSKKRKSVDEDETGGEVDLVKERKKKKREKKEKKSKSKGEHIVASKNNNGEGERTDATERKFEVIVETAPATLALLSEESASTKRKST